MLSWPKYFGALCLYLYMYLDYYHLELHLCSSMYRVLYVIFVFELAIIESIIGLLVGPNQTLSVFSFEFVFPCGDICMFLYE